MILPTDLDSDAPESLAPLSEVVPGELPSRLRQRDSMGALRPHQAAEDAALARGYAHGYETAQAEALDRLRTLLMQLLEAKFSTLADDALDRIQEANETRLEHWILALGTACSVGELLSGTEGGDE